MKKVITVLIGFGLWGFVSPDFSTSLYEHQAVLCASVNNSQPSAWVVQRLGQEFFDQEGARTVTDYPLAVRSVFTKGKDSRIFLVSRWHGLEAQKNYTFSCQWIDPDGQAYSMTSASCETPENLDPGTFLTYTAFMDLQKHMKEGEWAVHLFVNGNLVDAKDLTIASE